MNSIKEFVDSQTRGLTIKTPVAKPVAEEQVKEPEVPIKTSTVTGRPGRPKSGIQKTRVTLYLPVDVCEKAVQLWHRECRGSLNDILSEAVEEYIEKHF